MYPPPHPESNEVQDNLIFYNAKSTLFFSTKPQNVLLKIIQDNILQTVNRNQD